MAGGGATAGVVAVGTGVTVGAAGYGAQVAYGVPVGYGVLVFTGVPAGAGVVVAVGMGVRVGSAVLVAVLVAVSVGAAVAVGAGSTVKPWLIRRPVNVSTAVMVCCEPGAASAGIVKATFATAPVALAVAVASNGPLDASRSDAAGPLMDRAVPGALSQ